MMIRIILITM